MKTKICAGCGDPIKPARGRKLCVECCSILWSDGPRHPKLGDEAWKVEWCYELPLVSGTKDADVDAAKYRSKIFTSKQFAERYGRMCAPHDQFGGPLIYPVRFVDPWDDVPEVAGQQRHFRWEESGDPCEVPELRRE